MPGAPPSHEDTSQHGEASFLRLLVPDSFPRCLVDVGANDGVRHSNSFNFVNSGWEAVLIEPLPTVFPSLLKTYEGRHNATCINTACAEYAGSGFLFYGADGHQGCLSTLCRDNNEWFARTRSQDGIVVPVDTLTNILSSCRFEPDFSLLLIDTEGMDYEVLCGLDFSLYHPRIIVTEEYKHHQQKHRAKYSLLRANDYVLLRAIGCNSVWVRRQFQLALQTPPT